MSQPGYDSPNGWFTSELAADARVGDRAAYARQKHAPRRSLVTFPLTALLVATLLGVSRLWDPLSGDQALFLLGASALHNGGMLYRDFWDLKQPGIFEFYLGAGTAFGFTPLAMHVFELGVWLTLSIAQIAAIGPTLRRPALAGVAPLATAAAFYLGATIQDFGQPESLAGAPLFLSVWLFLASFQLQRRNALLMVCAAGLLSGLAVIGKLLFGAIAVAAIGGTFIAIGPSLAGGGWTVAAFCGSALIPLVAYLAATAAHHELGGLAYTWFVLPREIIAALPNAPVVRLVQDTKMYLTTFGTPVALAVIGICSNLRPEARPWRNAMLAWIAAAAAVILVQRFSWWEYHFMLFVVPIGVLATFGCDALVERLAELRVPQRRVTAAVAVCIAVLLLVPPVAKSARRVAALVTMRAAFSPAGAEHYRRTQSTEYNNVSEIAAFFDAPARRPKSIFVAGDPLVFMLSNTASKVSINGWGLELLLPAQWRTLEAQLAAARPDDVFVDSYNAPLIAQRSPAITTWLREKYRVAERLRLGVWYARRS